MWSYWGGGGGRGEGRGEDSGCCKGVGPVILRLEKVSDIFGRS